MLGHVQLGTGKLIQFGISTVQFFEVNLTSDSYSEPQKTSKTTLPGFFPQLFWRANFFGPSTRIFPDTVWEFLSEQTVRNVNNRTI